MKKLYTLLASALLVVSASAGAPMQKTISANIDAPVVDMSKAVITERNTDHNAFQARHNSVKRFRAQAADEPTLVEDSRLAGDYMSYSLGVFPNDSTQSWGVSMAQIEEYSNGAVIVYGLFDPDNYMVGKFDEAKKQITLNSFATTCPRTEQNALGQWVETDTVISVGAVSLETGYGMDLVFDVDVDNHYLSWSASDNGVQFLDAVFVFVRHKDDPQEDEVDEAFYFMNINAGWNSLIQFALKPNTPTNQYNQWYIYAEHSDDLREINVSNVFGGFFIPSSATNHNFTIQVSEDLTTAVAEDQVAQSFSDGDYLLWDGDLEDTIVNFEVGNGTLSGQPIGMLMASSFAAAPLLKPEEDALIYYNPVFAFLDFFFDNSGVESVTVADENAPVEYFNLQGVRVANPSNGLYIRRQGNQVSKVLVK